MRHEIILSFYKVCLKNLQVEPPWETSSHPGLPSGENMDLGSSFLSGPVEKRRKEGKEDKVGKEKTP